MDQRPSRNIEWFGMGVIFFADPHREMQGKEWSVNMVRYLIICRSLTYAQRTARVLERAGITGYVMRAPKLASDEGCAYCVRVAERWLTPALKILNREGIGPGRVLMESENGTYREVSL